VVAPIIAPIISSNEQRIPARLIFSDERDSFQKFFLVGFNGINGFSEL
jgi:hypothetical protein